jgi:hypothetical protein
MLPGGSMGSHDWTVLPSDSALSNGKKQATEKSVVNIFRKKTTSSTLRLVCPHRTSATYYDTPQKCPNKQQQLSFMCIRVYRSYCYT